MPQHHLSLCARKQFPDTFQEAVSPFHAGFLPFRVISAGEANIINRRTVSAPYVQPSPAGRYRCSSTWTFCSSGINQFMACRIFRFHDTAFLSRSTIASTGETQLRSPFSPTSRRHLPAPYPDTATVSLVRRVHHACITHQFVEEAEVEQVIMACSIPPM